MPHTTTALALALAGALLLGLGAEAPAPAPHVRSPAALHALVAPEATDELFRTSDRCLACHKGVSTSDGTDVSIGYEWRASMMANSARDPYWQAAVRREITEYPEAAVTIEATCSRCHMPMANVAAQADGSAGQVFANLPIGAGEGPYAALASDGVSCATCHQITDRGLGTEGSFEGGFQVSLETPADGRAVYGPFEPDAGGAGIMHSATGFRPTEGTHVQSADLCATCHTLLTHAVLPDGRGPEFPEQVPYQEWSASAFADEGRTCQSCHMPEVGEDVPVTAVLGRPRPNVSRHVFRGGNFFMLRILGRYRGELGVSALPQELALAAERTEEHLRTSTAAVSISDAAVADGRLEASVQVTNLAGHKFPTAYPSRRAWLHVTVVDAAGRTLLESGAFSPDGRIVGNDNDADGARYEPHYQEIDAADQVQIYEGIMVDGRGRPTTGLMSSQGWAKENRLLPRGFDTARLGDDRVGVVGAASSDPDFGAAGDRVRYVADVDPGAGPFTVTAELWFQPIGFRWAENLAAFEALETQRFVGYYRAMASGSALPIATTSTVLR